MIARVALKTGNLRTFHVENTSVGDLHGRTDRTVALQNGPAEEALSVARYDFAPSLAERMCDPLMPNFLRFPVSKLTSRIARLPLESFTGNAAFLVEAAK